MGPTPSISNGDKFLTKQNGWLSVIEYVNSTKIKIVFHETGYETWTNAVQIFRGTVKDKYLPRLYGIGFIGEGEHLAYYSRNNPTWEYTKWANMMMRCYSEGYKIKKDAYRGCSVTEFWHNYQNFAEWAKQQVGHNKCRWALDKDVLKKGNTEYSPENCCFLPQELNSVLIKTLGAVDRGDYALGVQVIPKTGRYRVLCQGRHVGVFGTEQEAFAAYKSYKEAFIRGLAEKWKGQIDPRAYEALMNYQVEIAD